MRTCKGKLQSAFQHYYKIGKKSLKIDKIITIEKNYKNTKKTTSMLSAVIGSSMAQYEQFIRFMAFDSRRNQTLICFINLTLNLDHD